MSHFIATTEKVLAGTPESMGIARKFLGVALFPDGANAANVVVYRGNAATAGKEIAAVRVPATESDDCVPTVPVNLDPEGGWHCVVTGTGAYAIVYFST